VVGLSIAAVLVLIAMLSVGIVTSSGAVPASSASAAARSALLRPRAVVGNSSTYDWAEFHLDQDLTGYTTNTSLSTANASQLGVAWATDLYGPALDSPVVAYDATLDETIAYVGTEDGDMLAVNVATGQIVWATWLGAPIRTTPAVAGGAVWFGTFDSPRVYKLDATTGAIDCSVSAPQPIEGTPVLADPPGGVPTVYVGNNDNTVASGPVLAIAASNCTQEWAFQGYTQTAGSWDAVDYAVDARGEPLIVFGTADPDSTVYAVDAVTGDLVWKFAVLNPPPATYDIGAGLEISPPGANGFADGVAYCPTKYGIMYALDLTTGAQIWSTNFDQAGGVVQGSEGGRSTAALDGDNLVFGYGAGLFDLNAVTGAVIWDYVDPTHTEALSSPAIAGALLQEIVAVGDIGGALDVVSLATGDQLYHYQTGGYTTASPAVTDGNILICSSDGFLYDFAVGGGNEAELPATTVTSPADSSSVTNPNGNLTIEGTASDSTGIAGVEVAVQENGSSGPWWDGATQSWSTGPVNNPATVTDPGATSSTWSFAYPQPSAGGAYNVTAYTVSTSGQSDIRGGHDTYSVLGSTKGAHIKATPAFVAPGATVTVSGSGYTASESISITMVGKVLATTNATTKGDIAAVKVKIPASAVFGQTAVTATGATSQRAAAAAITVANDWEELGYGSEHTGFEPNDPSLYNLIHPGGDIFVDKAWNYQTGAAVDTAPAIVNDVAYIANNAGQLMALDVHNGSPIWSSTLASGAAIAGSPAVDPAAGLVFVGADDGTVDAFATATGKLAWSTNIGGDVSAPVFGSGEVYVTTSAGVVEAVVETTGVKSWSTTLTSTTSGAPALDTTSKVLVVGESNGHVQELNATTGALDWVFDASGSVSASPTIEGGEVYFGSAGDYVYAISESTGAQTWSYKTAGSVTDTPSLDDALTPENILELVVGDSKGVLYALQATNGTLNYKISFKVGAITGVASVKGVAVLELSNGVIASARSYVDLDIWKYTTEAGLTTAPVIDDGTVYVGAGDGNLYAFTSYGQPPQ
jgi:outer membrane protein assembly factor BamB